MRIQFVSDIHLELSPIKKLSEFLKPSAPYLALCGDICAWYKKERLQTFLQYCSKHWKRVFYIAGNHEYYNLPRKHLKDVGGPRSMIQVEEWLRSECSKFPNVSFLQKEFVGLPEENCVVVGCTLWTEVAGFATKEAQQLMNDYKLIWINATNPVLVENLNAIHADHFSWLQATLGQIRAGAPGARIVVLTHHLPTHRMISPKFMGNPLNSCFASSALERCVSPHMGAAFADPERLAVKPSAWIFGHSHTRDWKMLDGVLCAINAHGYAGENTDGGNALNAVVDLTARQVEGLVPLVTAEATGASRKRPRAAMDEEDAPEE
jgi:predicted phosphodiesterase